MKNSAEYFHGMLHKLWRDKYFISILCLSSTISACNSSNVSENGIDELFFKNEFSFSICNGTLIESSYSESFAYSLVYDQYIIKFPNEKCLSNFYDGVKNGSSEYDLVDGKDYSRSMAVSKNKKTVFLINKISGNSVAFSISN